jgi:hypothetical protein
METLSLQGCTESDFTERQDLTPKNRVAVGSVPPPGQSQRVALIYRTNAGE